MSKSTPLCASPGKGEPLQVLGMASEILVRSEDTGGAWCLFEQTVPPGQGVPPHIHSREDEIFFVLEGSVEFFAGGEKHTANAGDVIHAPRDVPHGYEATGNSPAKIRFMTMPGDLEGMFREMATWPADEPPDMEKLGKLCAGYGIEFLR